MKDVDIIIFRMCTWARYAGEVAVEKDRLIAQDQGDCKALHDNVPAGLVVGCKKVKELVPKVRLARFHKESLPSRLGLSAGGEIETEAEASASSDGEA